MAGYCDFKAGDRFEIGFSTKQHMEGVWHHCGTFSDEVEARKAYDFLVNSDIAKGAKIGCRWRLTHDRDSTCINVLVDKRLTATGIAEIA